jgi:hypothetical protein
MFRPVTTLASSPEAVRRITERSCTSLISVQTVKPFQSGKEISINAKSNLFPAIMAKASPLVETWVTVNPSGQSKSTRFLAIALSSSTQNIRFIYFHHPLLYRFSFSNKKLLVGVSRFKPYNFEPSCSEAEIPVSKISANKRHQSKKDLK